MTDWYTVREAGAILKISRQRVHQLIEQGSLRSAQTHLGVLVEPRSVVRYQKSYRLVTGRESGERPKEIIARAKRAGVGACAS